MPFLELFFKDLFKDDILKRLLLMKILTFFRYMMPPI